MAKISRLISLITVCFSSKKGVVSSVKKLMMMIKIAINITKTIIKDQTSTVISGRLPAGNLLILH